MICGLFKKIEEIITEDININAAIIHVYCLRICLVLKRIMVVPDIRPFFYPVTGRISGSSIHKIVDIVCNGIGNYIVQIKK